MPEFLPEIPRDPYTGQELKYRKGKMTHRFRSIVEKDNAFDTKIEDEKIQGVRVYSVGKDLVDDGGRNWTMPVRSDFSDNNTKSFFCALPDGRYLFLISGPPPSEKRSKNIQFPRVRFR